MQSPTVVKLNIPIEEIVGKLEHLSLTERSKWEENIKSVKGLSWHDLKEIALLKAKSFGLFTILL